MKNENQIPTAIEQGPPLLRLPFLRFYCNNVLAKKVSIYVHLQKGFKVDSMLECYSFYILCILLLPLEKNLTFLMAHKGALEYVEKQQAGENHLFALILHL